MIVAMSCTLTSASSNQPGWSRSSQLVSIELELVIVEKIWIALESVSKIASRSATEAATWASYI